MAKGFRTVLQNQSKIDAFAARSWYNQQQKGLGARFSKDLKNTLLRIAATPHAFSVRYAGNRKASLDVFPYGVFFIVEGASHTIYITAIKHNARDIVF